MLGPLSQDWVLSAIRNVEVAADPTNVLALECALLRSNQSRTSKTSVSLAASQRVIRSQKYANPDAKAHFRLFSLCTAGKDRGNLQFETETVAEHIRFYLKCLRLFAGKETPLRVSIINLHEPEPYLARTLSTMTEDLKRDSANVTVETTNNSAEAKGYYRTLRFHIYGTSNQGRELELVDGGDTDWTQKLLGNAKERLVISGIGTERLCDNFTPIQPERS